MSKPKIDWSKNPHAGLDNDATWLKCENSTLRAKIKELEAEVARLKKANNDSLWCGQRDEARITELEAEVARLREELGQHCNVQLVNANARLTNKIAEVDLQSVLAYDAGKREATEAALRWAIKNNVYFDAMRSDEEWVLHGLSALLGEGK